MRLSRPVALVAAVALAASLGACSSSGGSASSGAPDAKVKVFVDALDALGIQHGAATATEAAALSRASYDITVDGFDAGINVFVNDEAQLAWVEASNALGGVSVTIDGAALSLNSTDGITDSQTIAPKIAGQVGGEAHGG